MSVSPQGRGSSIAAWSTARSSTPPRKHEYNSGLRLCSSVRKNARNCTSSGVVSSAKLPGSQEPIVNRSRSSSNHPTPHNSVHNGRNAAASQSRTAVISPDCGLTRMLPSCNSPCEKRKWERSAEGANTGELGYIFRVLWKSCTHLSRAGRSQSDLAVGLPLNVRSLMYSSEVNVGIVWEGEGMVKRYFKRDISLSGPSWYPLPMGQSQWLLNTRKDSGDTGAHRGDLRCLARSSQSSSELKL